MSGFTKSVGEGLSVDIRPFTDDNYFKLERIELNESLGGIDMAWGQLFMRGGSEKASEAEELVKKTYSINIHIKQNNPAIEMQIIGFIVHRDWTPDIGEFTLNFVCVPNAGKSADAKFFKENKTTRYKTITDAINGAWGDDRKRIDCEPTDYEMEYFQDNESNKTFLGRICKGYKANTIFGYTLEGFVLKDIIGKDRVEGKKEPCRTIVAGVDCDGAESFNMNYNKSLYSDVKTLNSLSLNFITEVTGDVYKIYSREARDAKQNSTINDRLLNSFGYSSFNIRCTKHLLDLKLGDTIIYGKGSEKEKPSCTKFFVSAAKYYFSNEQNNSDPEGNDFSVTYTLRGIEEITGEEMPSGVDADPSNSDTNVSSTKTTNSTTNLNKTQGTDTKTVVKNNDGTVSKSS